MPLYLRPPKAGRTPFFHVRGSYLGQRVERSTGTRKRAVAKQILLEIERECERGRFERAAGLTFAKGALDYMNAGGQRRPLKKLLAHFGDIALDKIDQAMIDGAAQTLFLGASAATQNREVYTPISAILKRAGSDFRIRRPKGSRGQLISAWLWPEEAARLFKAAKAIDKEFAILLQLLCYTGLRLSEALNLQCGDVRLSESYAHVIQTKTDERRGVYLPSNVVAVLANHPRGIEREGRVFRFAKSGYLYGLLADSAEAAGVKLPDRAAFHLFRHTYATWMRRYAGRDVKGLVATGAWKSEQSAARYAHVVPTEDARAAELLPVPGRARAKRTIA